MQEREEVLREKKTNREELKKLISEENTPKKQNKTKQNSTHFVCVCEQFEGRATLTSPSSSLS